MDLRKDLEDFNKKQKHLENLRNWTTLKGWILFSLASFGFFFLISRLVPDATFFEILGWWGLVNYGLMVLKSYAN